MVLTEHGCSEIEKCERQPDWDNMNQFPFLSVKSRHLPLNGLGTFGLFQRIQKRPYTRVIIHGKGIRSEKG